MAFASLRLASIRVVASADAKTAADAMRIAHDGGVESGYLQPAPSGMRFHPAFLNPGSRFVVAYDGDDPIGCLTLIEDGPFGFPSDRAFVEEIDGYRQAGDSLYEASGWVIRHDWRRNMLRVGAMLFAAGMRISLTEGDSNRRMVVAIEPNRVRVVAGIFEPDLVTESRPYLGLPAVLLATRRSAHWASDFLNPDAFASRKIVAEHVLDPDPAWLEFDPEGPHWADVLLPRLLQESDVFSRVEEQRVLLQGSSAHSLVR